MRRLPPLVATTTLLLAATWFACVGDDPGSTTPTTTPGDGGDGGGGGGERAAGERLGPCFPNKTCNEGLECRDGEICLAPDEPKPVIDSGTPDDAAGVDAGADAALDVFVPDANCPMTPPSAGTGPTCPEANKAACNAFEACCFGSAPNCTGNLGNACASGTAWVCDTNAHCLGPADAGLAPGPYCCAGLTPVGTKACGAAVAEYTVDYPAACQATACDTGPALRMCTIGEACPGAKTCKPIVVYRGGKPVTQGACL